MHFYILRKLELEIPPTSPHEFIPRFVSTIDATQKHEVEAERLLEAHSKEKNLSGHAPSVLAATAIYTAGMTLNMMIPQKLIGNVANVSVYSIRDEYKHMLQSDPKVNIDIDAASDGYHTHPAELTANINNTSSANYYIENEDVSN
jgi:transcription initiation factor TFIIIB Brf1 subunit/transcription initiation factor TFIIB